MHWLLILKLIIPTEPRYMYVAMPYPTERSCQRTLEAVRIDTSAMIFYDPRGQVQPALIEGSCQHMKEPPHE